MNAMTTASPAHFQTFVPGTGFRFRDKGVVGSGGGTTLAAAFGPAATSLGTSNAF
jgi:hypothetical protein